MARARVTTTKYEIIQVASEFFLEKGYSATSPRMIADELGLSPGNVTYYFPTKEHLLAVLVEMLCDYQSKLVGIETDKGIGSIGAICIEMMTVAAACQESETARDFFVSAFQSEMCREYLRQNHVNRAKHIFAKQCPDWTDEQFVQAEILIMGIQYASISATDDILPLKTRISGALHQILGMYNVDEDTRNREIEKVLQMDCRGIGKQVLKEFVDFVEKNNQQTLEDMLRSRRRKNKVANA